MSGYGLNGKKRNMIRHFYKKEENFREIQSD